MFPSVGLSEGQGTKGDIIIWKGVGVYKSQFK